MLVKTCGAAVTVTSIDPVNVTPPTARDALTVSPPAATANSLAVRPLAAATNVPVAGVVSLQVGGASGVGVVNIGFPF